MPEIVKVSNSEMTGVVAGLARDIWTEHYTPLIGREQVTYMLDQFQSDEAIAQQLQQGYEYYLLSQGPHQHGYLGILPDMDAGTLKISKIYVRSSERGRGFGKTLLQRAEKLARDRGICKLLLTVNKRNEHAIEWYHRMGFSNAASVVQDIGSGYVMDDYRFEKSISA